MKHIFRLLLLNVLFLHACTPTENLLGIILYQQAQKDICKSIPIDSIASKINIIMLEQPQDGWANITNLLETETSFYLIADDKIVYQYDKGGKFIRKMGDQGRGPGEYLYPKSLFLGQDSLLWVFDYNTQKMIKYNSSGIFLSSVEVRKNNTDTTPYLDAFFPITNDTLIFYTSANASTMDLLLYSPQQQSLISISKRNREMALDEALMGKTFNFGERDNKLIYNSFNDTVYILKNQKISPSFLIRMDDYRFKYEELTMNSLMSLSKSRIQINSITGALSCVFIFYTVINAVERKSTQYLGLYDLQSGAYSQNAIIYSDNPLTSIHPNEQLFNGYMTGEILKIGYSGENKELVSVIKYQLK